MHIDNLMQLTERKLTGVGTEVAEIGCNVEWKNVRSHSAHMPCWYRQQLIICANCA